MLDTGEVGVQLKKNQTTYSGAGVGRKEKVSSGSYTPPAKKKVAAPAASAERKNLKQTN